jgi:hypothetical protein
VPSFGGTDATRRSTRALGDMDKRSGPALAAYFALWAALAAGIIYGIVWAGYAAWIAVASACLLFIILNGSLAYGARVRKLRLEGKEAPSYLQFLLFPQGVSKLKEPAPRSTHLLVGVAAALIGMFLILCGIALAFDVEWSRISNPILVAGICVVLVGLGASFLYLAWRLVVFRARPRTNVA